MRNAGFLASKQQPTGSFVAPCPFHLLMAPPRNPDSGHRTFSQSKQMWDLTALLWGKTETGLFSRSLPIPFAYGTAQPHPSFVVAIEAFRLLGLILGGGANKSTGLGANKSKQPFYGEDLFAPPPKMGPRSGRKGWNCLPHPPKRAQEVAERPGLVCPAPPKWPKGLWTCLPRPPRSGRKNWTCLPHSQKGPKKWPKGLDLFALQNGLDLSKMDPRSGRKVCAHSICLWHRPTTPLQDAPLQPKLTGLLGFLPP